MTAQPPIAEVITGVGETLLYFDGVLIAKTTVPEHVERFKELAWRANRAESSASMAPRYYRLVKTWDRWRPERRSTVWSRASRSFRDGWAAMARGDKRRGRGAGLSGQRGFLTMSDPIALLVNEMPWSREMAEDERWFSDYAKVFLASFTCRVLTRRDSLRGTEFLCRGEEAK